MKKKYTIIYNLLFVLGILFLSVTANAQKDTTAKKIRKNDSLMLASPKYYLLLDGMIYQSAVSENGKQDREKSN